MAHLFNRFSGHKILLFSLLLPLLISIVFSSSSFPFFIVSILLLLISTVFILRPLISDSIRDCQLPSLVHFVAMSRVVNNNRGFLQLLADCPVYQRQFLLKNATPQQLHVLVEVLHNMPTGHISIPEENKRILQSYEVALLDLVRPNVPYKTKKRVLVQEGCGFIEDLVAPVVSSVGFLML